MIEIEQLKKLAHGDPTMEAIVESLEIKVAFLTLRDKGLADIEESKRVDVVKLSDWRM